MRGFGAPEQVFSVFCSVYLSQAIAFLSGVGREADRGAKIQRERGGKGAQKDTLCLSMFQVSGDLFCFAVISVAGWRWDVEAQQLLRMCQAARAVHFLTRYLTTSWLLFLSYCTNVCVWGCGVRGFGSRGAIGRRIVPRSCREKHSHLSEPCESAPGAFRLAARLRVSRLRVTCSQLNPNLLIVSSSLP